MALYDVVVALRNQFELRKCPVPILFGEQFLDEHRGSRIVIVPGTDGFSQQLPSTTPLAQTRSINPRPVATRITGCTVNFLAAAPSMLDPMEQFVADSAAMDSLINTFFASLQATVAGIFSVAGGQYVTGQVTVDRYGLVYNMALTVQVPILDIAWPEVAITPCVKTFTDAPATGDITVSELLGDPPALQPAVNFRAPIPQD